MGADSGKAWRTGRTKGPSLPPAVSVAEALLQMLQSLTQGQAAGSFAAEVCRALAQDIHSTEYMYIKTPYMYTCIY